MTHLENLPLGGHCLVKEAIEAVCAKVLFTPPYHPEFNPIEKTWGKLKDLLRRWNTLTREAFDGAVAEAMKHITISDIGGWFRHAGYAHAAGRS
ncbi:MAG: hypothetical protein GY822_14850 [Deltaproteobacteria bacterium]|nr:hypothetical protein [Deltaproteobacteria bacterium]